MRKPRRCRLNKGCFGAYNFVYERVGLQGRDQAVHTGVFFDHDVAALGFSAAQVIQIVRQCTLAQYRKAHVPHDAETLRVLLAAGSAALIGSGEKHAQLFFNDIMQQGGAAGSLLASFAHNRGAGLPQGLAAHGQILSVSLGLCASLFAQAGVAGQRRFKNIRRLVPLAAGSQGHAKVAQRKGRVFMAFAQKAAPQGHGLAVQGNALGMVALFFLYAPKIVEAGSQPGRCLWLRLPYLHGTLQAVLRVVELLLAVTGGRKVKQCLGHMGRIATIHSFTQVGCLSAQNFALLGVARF